MNPPDPNETSAFANLAGGALGGLVTLLAALALGTKKALKMWGEAKTEHAHDSAQSELINGLRDEVSRLADQNAKLAECVNSMQMQLISLRGENADLHTTVRHLNKEVGLLRRAGAHSGFGGLDDKTRA
jgi:uncharacterized protein YlxW (UPF0749 family)